MAYFEGLSEEQLINRVGRYIDLRWVFIAILGSLRAIVFYISGNPESAVRHLLVALALGVVLNLILAGLTALAKQRQRGAKLLASLQPLADLIVITLVAYYFGVMGNDIILLYLATIVVSGYLLGSRYAYFASALSFLSILIYPLNAAAIIQNTGPFFVPYMVFYAGVFGLAIASVAYLDKATREEETVRAQVEVISLVSHQLRTPASAVKGFLSLMLDPDFTKLGVKQRTMIAQAYNENEIELKLIENILAVAKLDFKSQHIHTEENDLLKLMAEVVREHQSLSKQRGQKIRLSTHLKTLPADIDPVLIRIVIDNLLSNAGKYSPHGSTIILTASSNDPYAVFSVEDNGAGIPKREQRRLFRRFSQIKSGFAAQSGAGLGLYLVKRIIDLHKGKVGLVSYPGEGTIFTVQLPLKQGNK